MKKRTPPLLITLLAGHVCWAQSASPEVFTTSGGSGASTTANVNWTIGEPVTETAQGNAFALTQGFQQPELQISTALPESGPAWDVAVFPNPSASWIEIDLDKAPKDATVRLYAASGQLAMTERMNGMRLVLDVSRLTAGSYLLDLQDAATGQRARFNLNKTH